MKKRFHHFSYKYCHYFSCTFCSFAFIELKTQNSVRHLGLCKIPFDTLITLISLSKRLPCPKFIYHTHSKIKKNPHISHSNNKHQNSKSQYKKPLDGISRRKWVFASNLQIMQQNTHVLKLFSKMSLFLKLDFNKIKLFVKFNIVKIKLYEYF